MMNILNLALICAGLAAVTAYYRPGLDGDYCGGAEIKCCKDRQDHCSAVIRPPGGSPSVCYCDDFCDDLQRRNSREDDCCPDFQEVCRGVSPTTEDPGYILACVDGNKYYEAGVKIKRGCNECVCKVDPGSPRAYFECDTEPCITSAEVLRGVASDPYSTWRPYNYTQFSGRKLKDGLIYKLGTLPLNAVRESPVPSKKGVMFPTEFDAKQRWPDYLSPVVDQEWCGSDWAITVATVASDRFAIQSNGAEKVVLSPQILLSCNKEQRGCTGGHVDIAWNYARLFGLVDEECSPYKASVTRCKFYNREDQDQLIKDGCRPVVEGRTSRYKVGPLYRIKNEADIMYDIMTSGPVHAVMTVYQDFFHYHDGIYRRSRYGNNYLQGLHSVRIIGWGEDRGDKYWVVANSWGCDWGENGYFRIARGQNESGIESFVIAAWSEVTEAYRKTI